MCAAGRCRCPRRGSRAGRRGPLAPSGRARCSTRWCARLRGRSGARRGARVGGVRARKPCAWTCGGKDAWRCARQERRRSRAVLPQGGRLTLEEADVDAAVVQVEVALGVVVHPLRPAHMRHVGDMNSARRGCCAALLVGSMRAAGGCGDGPPPFAASRRPWPARPRSRQGHGSTTRRGACTWSEGGRYVCCGVTSCGRLPGRHHARLTPPPPSAAALTLARWAEAVASAPPEVLLLRVS